MLKTSRRPGKPLEQLIATLERVLANGTTAGIESPAYLADRITGERREHDVLLRVRTSHHETIIAIECRDRSRKTTVNEVEGFYQKCRDTGVDQGVMVSALGFTRTAIAKGRFETFELWL